MSIARVFPRRTNATPTDDLAFVGGPGLFPPHVDAVHISVTFDWDRAEAERLAREWADVAPVHIGGPTFDREQKIVPPTFTASMYLKPGYVITSRGCPNHCWFCKVQPGPVEMPIVDGYNVLDDNLLACSEVHILNVMDMLRRQHRQPEFTGGLEAARLTPAIAEALRSVRPKTMFFAYDTPDDWEPLVRAAGMCWHAGFSKASHNVRAYVLVGWPKDTMDAAEQRLRQVLTLGIVPMAMLWRGTDGKRNPAWRTFQRIWARPSSVCAMRDMA